MSSEKIEDLTKQMVREQIKYNQICEFFKNLDARKASYSQDEIEEVMRQFLTASNTLANIRKEYDELMVLILARISL